MFEFTSKAKRFAYLLVILGVIGVVIGFVTNGGHDSHSAEGHKTEAHAADDSHSHDDHKEAAHHEADGHDGHAEEAHHGGHGDADAHQIANRPWSAIYVNAIFFLGLGIGALFFLAIQYAAQVGWSAGLTRVLEAQALWLIVPILVILFVIIAGLTHTHHMWHWMAEGIMEEGSPNYDALIAGKSGFLNGTFFVIRTIAYIVIWFGAAMFIRKKSQLEDLNGGTEYWVKLRKFSALFLVLYAVTSSTSAWDWIMSIDAHWFSTLFGWYAFAGMFVSSMTVLALVVLYLKNQGYLEWINENHIQDLGKFIFAFSVFWTYLWFSQYMLYWYSNMAEEVAYFMQRFDQYKFLFISMVVLNFVFPILLIMSRDAKRNNSILIFAGVFVIVGHWIDHFVMIMPGSVGSHYGIGWVEIGGFALFSGLFILVVLSNLTKAPLLQKNHPMLKESEVFHQ